MSNLLENAPGKKALLMGNEALVRGAIEAGLNFACSYPGTPSSEVPTLLFGLQAKGSFRMEFGANEKVAMEMAAGAALSGVNALTSMKHVGLNVASDPLGTVSYMDIRGALVIYNADDPSLFSSQNEQDNRAFSRLFGVPMFEPATAQDMKDMTVAAFRLSHEMNMPVIVRSTTRVAHCRGIVEYGEIASPASPAHYEKDPRSYVCVPANSIPLHRKLVQKLDATAAIGNSSPFNVVYGPADARFGIVANGISVNYALDAIKELDLEKDCALFKLGFSYPEPDEALLAFLRGKEKILVVEELEPWIEDHLRVLAQKNGLSCEILGKGCGRLSRLYEYSTEIVTSSVADAFGAAWKAPEQPDLSGRPPLPVRPPNLCPGCPHRMTYYAAKLACEGRDVVFINDIGCYSLGVQPPMKMSDIAICMGGSASIPCGFAEGIRGTGQKTLSFIGDSTFFHSGMTGLASAVYNGHKFTLVVLDNEVTAMTGHQPSPAFNPQIDERAAMAGMTPIDIEAVCKALGVPFVRTVNPKQIKKLRDAIAEALDFDGLAVVIAKEPCPLHNKKQGKAGKVVFTIDKEKCTECRTCLTEYGCPAFQPENGRIVIDPAQCAGCAVCVQVCPAHAIKKL